MSTEIELADNYTPSMAQSERLPMETVWLREAARSHFAMGCFAEQWHRTGDGFYLRYAIEARDDRNQCRRLAAEARAKEQAA